MKSQLGITVVLGLAAILHLAFPELVIDWVTVALLMGAAAPWLAPIVKRVELPGGFKIELQDVKTATDKVGAGARVKGALRAGDTFSAEVIRRDESTVEQLRAIAAQDPNLALVGLRIELEKRLSAIATQKGIATHRRSAGALLRELQRVEALPPELASGLNDLISLGNRAAHGTEVTSDAVAWALDSTPLIFEALENLAYGPEQEPTPQAVPHNTLLLQSDRVFRGVRLR